MNPTTYFVLLLLGGYLLGSVPAAYLAARLVRDIDIRRYGSGNIGASNLWRSTSKWLAIPVILFDLGKGMPLVWLAVWLGLGVGAQVAIGLAAIIGHNWPVFLGFNGGRGMLTTLGVVFVLPVLHGMLPWEALVAIVIAVIGAVLHIAPVAVGAVVAMLPLLGWALDRPTAITLGFLGMFLIMVVRRLTAPKTSLTPALPWRQLLLNRLLFDRDIRDKEAWLHRRPPRPKRPGASR